ncbi:DUF4250 domain-containing protein [Clostridium thermobutyricum]|uniref:DUF4250 domain-containing protein n=1 Tax=Clostridium thermobutyricum TaxID=29372 RepID=N9Y3D7_9CLOT|nr:DUF4250 domain-containing protein [Clostridium thermobutyricum]ENZ02332.1 hypothetical protein HMPREF1092_01567 [Clostridium thermobutyricum]
MDIENMDVNILVSIINLKLRDFYSNLDDLCDDMDISKETLINKLKEGNYEYIKENNSFK